MGAVSIRVLRAVQLLPILHGYASATRVLRVVLLLLALALSVQSSAVRFALRPHLQGCFVPGFVGIRWST